MQPSMHPIWIDVGDGRIINLDDLGEIYLNGRPSGQMFIEGRYRRPHKTEDGERVDTVILAFAPKRVDATPSENVDGAQDFLERFMRRLIGAGVTFVRAYEEAVKAEEEA